jgi:hypothetical protein
MRRITMIWVFGLLAMLSAGSFSPGAAGEPHAVAVMLFAGHVKAITIHTCGLQPGGCRGSLVLATEEGGEVSIALLPAMRIERGEQVVTVDTLAVGDYIRVRRP